MTNEDLQAHLKALNDAAARGEIQFASFAHPGEWIDFGPNFLDAKKYRIKPLPREVWVRIYADGSLQASMDGPPHTNFRSENNVVKFREVIE